MEQQQSSLKEKERIDLREPRRFKVTIYNDDFTTMEFVVKDTNHRFLQIIGGSRNSDAASTQKRIGRSRHLHVRHRPLQSRESAPAWLAMKVSPSDSHRHTGRRIKTRNNMDIKNTDIR